MGLALYSLESPDTFDSLFLFFQDDTQAKSLWSHCLSSFHVWGWHTESHLSGICLCSRKWAKRHRLDPGQRGVTSSMYCIVYCIRLYTLFPFIVRLNPVQMSWITTLHSGLKRKDVAVFSPSWNTSTRPILHKFKIREHFAVSCVSSLPCILKLQTAN